jgi:hypothetical protein
MVEPFLFYQMAVGFSSFGFFQDLEWDSITLGRQDVKSQRSDMLEPVSKMWIRVQGKARNREKAEHTR